MTLNLNRMSSYWNRDERIKINDNWDKIEESYNGVVDEVTQKAYNEIIDTVRDLTKINWLEPVPTYDDIAATYPNPTLGDITITTDDGSVYRYDGEQWVYINKIDPDVYMQLQDDVAAIQNGLEETNNNLMQLQQDFMSRLAEKVDKGSLFVNVKDFGAVGDGITDDTNAIQSAIDSVLIQASGRDGALVFFPAGSYLISDAIKVYGNITIQGVGRRGSTLLLKAGSTATAMILREGGTTSVYWTQIRDICLDGQASLQTANTEGIRLENVSECYIHNVGIRFVRSHAIHILGINGASSIQPTIKDCIIRADINNHMEDASGIFLDSNSYDAMVSGNDIGFYKNGYGIRTISHNGAFLTDNNVWQCKTGYNIQSSNRMRLANCLSDYSQEYGFLFNTSTELQLSNCQSRWSSNKPDAFQIYDGFHFYNSSKFIITGCTVFGGDGTDLIDGGTGQTAYAIAMTGTTTNGKIVGLLSNNVKGDIYQDTGVTNIEKTSTIDDNLLSGLIFVGNGSSTVNVTFTEARRNNSYSISITPTWNTRFWVSNITENGFTINFESAPTEDKNCYWTVTQI